MKNFVPVGFELPVPSTALEGSVELRDIGARVSLHARFSEAGKHRHTELSFSSVRAHRHRAEVHCTADHIEGAYDTLVEIRDSVWIAELRRDTAHRWRDAWKMRHYMIYFDSSGCYEIVADSWSAETLDA